MDDTEPSRKRRRVLGRKNLVPSTSREVIPGSNSNVDKQIKEWLGCEYYSGSEAEDSGENYVAEQIDHNLETEESASENEEHEPDQTSHTRKIPFQAVILMTISLCQEWLVASTFYGKNPYKWAQQPPNKNSSA